MAMAITITGELLLLALVFFAQGPSSCLAQIKHSAFRSDSRSIILFEKFGFTFHGSLNVSVSHVAFTISHPSSPHLDLSLLGFFISTDDALLEVLLEYQQKTQVCALRNHLVKRLFTFQDLDANNAFTHSFPVPDANEYSLYFASCLPHVSVSMNVRTEMYNVDARTGEKVYLPAGQTQLPKLYLFFFLVYLGLTGLWIHICWKNKEAVHSIHILMGVLVLFKAFNLISEAEDKAHIKSSGTPHGWDIAFYVFSFLKGITLFAVIVLIGTGWSFLKPFLQDKDKRILMVVIPLQVFANIANVAIDETGPFAKDWRTWKQIFIVVDILCCFAVLFPIMWSIRDLRTASQTDGKAAKTLVKLSLFRQYYIVVFVYIYFTRVVVFALTTVIVYKYSWVSDCTEEVASLAFYLFTGYNFRPGLKNPYLVLDDEDEAAAANEALKSSDFEL